MAFKRETVDRVVAFLDALAVENLREERPPRPRAAETTTKDAPVTIPDGYANRAVACLRSVKVSR